MNVSQTILQQLGGTRFMSMTGAKNFLTTDNGLTMKVGKNAKGVSHIKITLVNDLYNIEALSIRGFNEPKSKGQFEGVHAENLRSAFTTLTGLETSL